MLVCKEIIFCMATLANLLVCVIQYKIPVKTAIRMLTCGFLINSAYIAIDILYMIHAKIVAQSKP